MSLIIVLFDRVLFSGNTFITTNVGVVLLQLPAVYPMFVPAYGFPLSPAFKKQSRHRLHEVF